MWCLCSLGERPGKEGGIFISSRFTAILQRSLFHISWCYILCAQSTVRRKIGASQCQQIIQNKDCLLIDLTILQFCAPKRQTGLVQFVVVTEHLLLIVYLQFFTHPVIDNLKNDKWYGDLGEMWTPSYLSIGRWKWMFIDLWCLFDLALFPVVFIVLYLIHLGKAKWSNSRGNLWTPHFNSFFLTINEHYSW